MQKHFLTISIIILIFILGLILRENFKGQKKIADRSSTIVANANIINSFPLTKIPQKKGEIDDPQILTKSSYLIDIDSAYQMYGNNEREKSPIASTTKIITAMVILDDYSDRLNDVVSITKDMINTEPSIIKLKVGEKITVESLLEGMLIMSGNDAAYSLADYFGGRPAFVSQMNQKVAQLGLVDTRLEDPAGLNDQGYSTAKDLAVIGAYALRHEKFAKIISNPQKNISSIDGQIIHELVSTDRLIIPAQQYYYDKSIGGKTGFTNMAGYVLVSAAQNNGHKILSVVLNTQEKSIFASAKESKKLLEWGFNNWQWD